MEVFGLYSKWYLVLGALQKGWWPVAVVVLAGSLLVLVTTAGCLFLFVHPEPFHRLASLLVQ